MMHSRRPLEEVRELLRKISEKAPEPEMSRWRKGCGTGVDLGITFDHKGKVKRASRIRFRSGGAHVLTIVLM
jgi:hypothetical protein